MFIGRDIGMNIPATHSVVVFSVNRRVLSLAVAEWRAAILVCYEASQSWQTSLDGRLVSGACSMTDQHLRLLLTRPIIPSF